jgi:uncharacterized membrane protein YphA (DoxX/SURF4 family)
MRHVDTRTNAADSAWWALRLGFFLAPVIAGADKFFHYLVNWDQYLSPMVQRFLPVSGHNFMLAVGVIEIVAGLLVMTRWTRYAGYIISAWLLGIIVNLLSMGAYYDIALRDLGLAIGAFALAKLTEARGAGVRTVRTDREIPIAA